MGTPPHGLSRIASPALLAILLVIGASGCTTNRRTDMDASSIDVGSEIGPVDVPGDDATGTTCQAIRICLANQQSLDTCLARATAAAQDTFNKLLTCLTQKPAPNCTGTDLNCYCPEECYADGYCLDETEACLNSSGVADDGVCTSYCAP